MTAIWFYLEEALTKITSVKKKSVVNQPVVFLLLSLTNVFLIGTFPIHNLIVI
jgi:hypothetical protein